MKRISLCLITGVIVMGCAKDAERRFIKNEAKFLNVVNVLKKRYANHDFSNGQALNIINCSTYQKEFNADICNDQLSGLLEELDLKKVSVVEAYCNGGHSPVYEIHFIYSNASVAPVTFVVYDACDELIADESDFVEIKKLKPEWYVKTDHNFP